MTALFIIGIIFPSAVVVLVALGSCRLAAEEDRRFGRDEQSQRDREYLDAMVKADDIEKWYEKVGSK